MPAWPYVEIVSSTLFCVLFLFLWSKYRAAYLGCWAIAWAVNCIAWDCALLGYTTAHFALQAAFAVAVIVAARAGIQSFVRKGKQDKALDYLTGLLNQGELRFRMDSDETFHGVAVVCDLDDFKSINDRFGHVVGDEVLRSVGHLLHSSIRAEDRAYRWGGDEFAILFNDQAPAVAISRMQAVEARLHEFQVRGHGSLNIHCSWGVAEGKGEPLSAVIDLADREMYARKRERSEPTSS